MNLYTIPAFALAASTTNGPAPSSSKLHNAAQQFEALMIGEIMKSEREAGSGGWLGSGDDSGDDSAMDMAEGQLSNALAAGGGFGVAKMIEKTMAGASADPQINTAALLPSSSVSHR